MSCPHSMLQVWDKFEHSTPIRCVQCRASFSVPDALAHVRAYNEIVTDPMKEAGVLMAYAHAAHIEGDDGVETLALPDLNIDVSSIDDGAYFPREMFNDLIWVELDERFEQGLLPPWPRNILELQETYPSFEDWEWEMINIPVTEFLEPNAVK